MGVGDMCLFLTVPWVGQRNEVVAFPGHSHLHFACNCSNLRPQLHEINTTFSLLKIWTGFEFCTFHVAAHLPIILTSDPYWVWVLTHIRLASFLWDIGKQCRARSDAAKCGVWSGSPLFAYKRLYWNLNKFLRVFFGSKDYTKELKLECAYFLDQTS